MSAVIGALRAELSASIAQWQSDMGKAADSVKGFAAKFQKIGGKMQSIGNAMSLSITAPFAALVGTSYMAAREAQQAAGQVSAALQSMGDAAGRSQEQLEEAAAGLMKISTFDDDEILRKVTANMLTFGNVAKEQFDRAQLAAVNLSARMGADLQSSALMVGKALNDPIKGLAAMSRVGIQFTEAQKAQITAMTQSGNVIGAQTIILGELERQFGGAAQALRNATPDAALRNAWDDFQETIGAIAIKILPPITAGLTALLKAFNGLDAGTQTVVLAFAGVVAVLGPVISVVGTLVSAFGAISSVVVPAVTAAGPLIGAALTVMTGPIGIVIAAVGALIAIWVLFGDDITAALQKAWQWVQSTFVKIRDAVSLQTGKVLVGLITGWQKARSAVIEAVAAMVKGVIDWFGSRLRAAVDGVKNLIGTVTKAFKDMYIAVVGNSYVPDMVDEIGQHMSRLDGLMVKPAEQAARETAGIFQGLADDVAGSMDGFGAGGFSGGMGDTAGGAFGDAARKGLNAAFENNAEMRDQFAGVFADGMKAALKGDFKGWFQNWWQTTLSNSMQRILEGLGGQIFDMIGGKGGFGGFGGGGLWGAIANGIFGPKTGGMGGGFGGGPSGGGVLSALFSGGFRAGGGPVNPGRSYVVGEFQPEVFKPSVSGVIEPGGGGTTQIFNIKTPDADSFRRSQRQIARSARGMVAGI